MTICPIRVPLLKEWLHEEALRPYLEAIERLIRAWRGVDFHSIFQNKLSWKERIISLVVGILLLIPLFNIAVWKGWVAFGNPEVLSPPFASGSGYKEFLFPTPSERLLQMDDSPVEVAAAPPFLVEETAALPFKTEQMDYSETDGKGLIYSHWKIDYFQDKIMVWKENTHEKVRSRYTHKWELQEYEFRSADGKNFLHAILHGKKIHVKAGRPGHHGEKVLILKEHYPWAQQPNFMFRAFVESKDRQRQFYGLNPEGNISLVHCIAEKTGEEEWNEKGNKIKVMKIETRGTGFYLWLKNKAWVDTATGNLRKFVCKLPHLTIHTL